jgi:hypothetical protein
MKDHFKTKLHKKRYIDFLFHNNHHQLVDKVTSELVCVLLTYLYSSHQDEEPVRRALRRA